MEVTILLRCEPAVLIVSEEAKRQILRVDDGEGICTISKEIHEVYLDRKKIGYTPTNSCKGRLIYRIFENRHYGEYVEMEWREQIEK